MTEQEYKKEFNRLRANLRYYKIMNKTYKKENTFVKYDNRLLESKLKRLVRLNREKSYLITELLKKLEVNND